MVSYGVYEIAELHEGIRYHSFFNIMPWTKHNYPVLMKYLPQVVRDKAIEIANELIMEENMDGRLAIAIAINQAKKWAARQYLSESRGISYLDRFFH